MKKILILLFALLIIIPSAAAENECYPTGKPYTRWWWFASKIDTMDIKYQLDWLKENGFGGVEIAWIYPLHGDSTAPRFEWLSGGWSNAVAFAKDYAESVSLGCDFTFGTLWPFGDSRVPEKYGSRSYNDTISEKTMRLTWEHPIRGRVINHLDSNALRNYSQRIGTALKPALEGSKSGIFVDSWEVDTRYIWTPGLDTAFRKRYGYDITDFIDSIYEPGYEDIYYDYMKLISEYVTEQFYRPFTNIARELGAFSRAQCGGAPADLLTAFSSVDVPETEAILYEPYFAKIPASAALLSSKNIVSAETFTCLYGWKGWPGPGPHQGEENVYDLKMLCDALFANGVNQIIWHGMPFNAEGDTNMFYASVHTGPECAFEEDLPEFNAYMQKVSGYLRKGRLYSDVAVYLPYEDGLMGVEYPDSLQFPWVWGEYELRYIRTPDDLKGYSPAWINGYFLNKAKMEDNKLIVGDAEFKALYIDVEYIDLSSLKRIFELAATGFPVCLRNIPKQPGRFKDPEFKSLIKNITELENVSPDFSKIYDTPQLIGGADIPDFICRETDDDFFIFFSNPDSQDLKYPIGYEQSMTGKAYNYSIKLSFNGKSKKCDLRFAPHQSILLQVDKDLNINKINIDFRAKEVE